MSRTGNRKMFVVKPKGKSQLRRPRYRWANNISICFKDVDLINLGQGPDQHSILVINKRFTS